SFATPERHQRLDMKGLRKNVEQMKGSNLIGSRSPRPACQGAQVARQRGWIAGEISDAGRRDLHQARERRARNACSGRVEHDEIRSFLDRKSTRLNSSHGSISYAVFCLQKKTNTTSARQETTQR